MPQERKFFPDNVWVKIANAGQTVESLETDDRDIYYASDPLPPTIERTDGIRLKHDATIINWTLTDDLYVQSLHPGASVRMNIK